MPDDARPKARPRSADARSVRALVVPYARVEEIRRHEPGRARAGDWARARLQAGVLDLLEAEVAGAGFAIGAGYQSRLSVPFGLAATAAYAVVAPGQAAGGYWTGRDVDVTWTGEAASGDILLASAEIEEIDEGLARLLLKAWTQDGRHLLDAVLRLSAVQGGKVLPSRLVPLRPVAARIPPNPRPGFRFVADVHSPGRMVPGEACEVGVTLVNAGDRVVELVLRGELPLGHGLGLPDGAERQASIEPGGWVRLSLTVRADRPQEVNLGRPWELRLVISGEGAPEVIAVPVIVEDPDPGRLLYVLTEDCETFDGGEATGDYGARAELGNRNNFMDPEEYRLQMIDKPRRMNEIAEGYGARWTHFFTCTQRFAAAWAARQSASSTWHEVVAELDASVLQGCRRHEYAAHIHFDYEPDSLLEPQPRLIHDAATDGILPNQYYDPITNPEHRYHDWDGAARGGSLLKELGDLWTLDSKTGSLYKSLHFLARLQFGQRISLVARIGSFDFGKTPQDQRVSTAAFSECGLRCSSDAYMAWLPPRQRGQLFWCREDDRVREVDGLSEVRLAQLAVCHDTDFTRLEEDQRWFAEAVEAARGPGVRVIMTMAHAMFMRGEPDAFRSLDGGSFANLDRFLKWVRCTYPEVRFATATEALLEYLDYYSPQIEAHVEPVPCAANPPSGLYEFPIRLLGKGIVLSAENPFVVRVSVPPFVHPGEIERLRVCDGDAVLAELWQPQADKRPSLLVTLTATDLLLRLQVQVKEQIVAELAERFEAVPSPRFVEPGEPCRAPLLHVRPGGLGSYTTDLLRLLMHPVAGHPEPLGRRLHPLGVLAMGICMTEALAEAGRLDAAQAGQLAVRRLTLRWRKAMPMDASLRASSHQRETGAWVVQVRDQTGAVICDSEVEVAAAFHAVQVALASRAQAGAPDAEDAEQMRERLRLQAARFHEALATYRSLRGWRLMLFAQKAYALLRQGPRPFLAWVLNVLRGRPDLATHELQFPSPDDFS